ncbi:MAG: hypothetical protein CMM80_02880 [Rhodospirillaceae bacterium]|nr:hypothetical protein [Rhodospirillaceae bacterium]
MQAVCDQNTNHLKIDFLAVKNQALQFAPIKAFKNFLMDVQEGAFVDIMMLLLSGMSDSERLLPLPT